MSDQRITLNRPLLRASASASTSDSIASSGRPKSVSFECSIPIIFAMSSDSIDSSATSDIVITSFRIFSNLGLYVSTMRPEKKRAIIVRFSDTARPQKTMLNSILR